MIRHEKNVNLQHWLRLIKLGPGFFQCLLGLLVVLYQKQVPLLQDREQLKQLLGPGEVHLVLFLRLRDQRTRKPTVRWRAAKLLVPRKPNLAVLIWWNDMNNSNSNAFEATSRELLIRFIARTGLIQRWSSHLRRLCNAHKSRSDNKMPKEPGYKTNYGQTHTTSNTQQHQRYWGRVLQISHSWSNMTIQ